MQPPSERNRRGKVQCRDKGVPVFAFDVDSRQAPKGLFAVTLGLGQIAGSMLMTLVAIPALYRLTSGNRGAAVEIDGTAEVVRAPGGRILAGKA